MAQLSPPRISYYSPGALREVCGGGEQLRSPVSQSQKPPPRIKQATWEIRMFRYLALLPTSGNVAAHQERARRSEPAGRTARAPERGCPQLSRRPIHHRHQIQKAVPLRDVGDVDAAYRVRPLHRRIRRRYRPIRWPRCGSVVRGCWCSVSVLSWPSGGECARGLPYGCLAADAVPSDLSRTTASRPPVGGGNPSG